MSIYLRAARWGQRCCKFGTGKINGTNRTTSQEHCDSSEFASQLGVPEAAILALIRPMGTQLGVDRTLQCENGRSERLGSQRVTHTHTYIHTHTHAHKHTLHQAK